MQEQTSKTESGVRKDKIGIYDLMSFFWLIAGTRTKEEGTAGLALAVLLFMRETAHKLGLDTVAFGADGPPGSRSWRIMADPKYKGDRSPKDPEKIEECEALIDALTRSEFTVIRKEAMGPSSASAGEPLWFEGEDCCSSLAYLLAKKPEHEVLIASQDWDLAQVVAYDVPIKLFSCKGEERTKQKIEAELSVPPDRVVDLFALAGDPSDGYKPFPGPEQGKPGIGEKIALKLLAKYKTAKGVIEAALDPEEGKKLAEEFKPRIAALLTNGGTEALTRGLRCATIRTDVPLPDDIDPGDDESWKAAEKILRERKEQQIAAYKAKRQESAEKPAAPAESTPVEEAIDEGEASGFLRDLKPENVEPLKVASLAPLRPPPEDEGIPDVPPLVINSEPTETHTVTKVHKGVKLDVIIDGDKAETIGPVDIEVTSEMLSSAASVVGGDPIVSRREREKKASDVLDMIPLGTAEEERRRSKVWFDEAARYSRNEEYWRERAANAEKALKKVDPAPAMPIVITREEWRELAELHFALTWIPNFPERSKVEAACESARRAVPTRRGVMVTYGDVDALAGFEVLASWAVTENLEPTEGELALAKAQIDVSVFEGLFEKLTNDPIAE